MTVRCAHCGEELLGAVNRCWKCGQQFVARATVEGLPPVRVEAEDLAAVAAQEPLEARVLDDAEVIAATETTVIVMAPAGEAVARETQTASAPGRAAAPDPTAPQPPESIFSPPPHPLAPPLPLPVPAMRRYVPPRPNLAALGGAYAAALLGIFALVLAPFRWEAAIVAFCGLMMGIWGVYSPRRGWALVGMLLCAVAIGWGTFTGVQELWLYLHRNAPIVQEEPLEEDAMTP